MTDPDAPLAVIRHPDGSVTIKGSVNVTTAVHDAFCWEQPEDGRLIACDRKKDHQGGHSWEAK